MFSQFVVICTILFVVELDAQVIAEPDKPQVEPPVRNSIPVKQEQLVPVLVDNDLQTPLNHAVAPPPKQILARGNGSGRRRQHGGQGRRGGRGRNRNPAQKYYKPLLRVLKQEDRRELRHIVRANITKAQIAEKVQKWIQEAEDPKAKEAFELFQQERALMKKLKLIGEENFLEDKSEEAKKLYLELKQLKEDQSLTWDQTCTRRNQLLQKAKSGVIEELRRKGKPCYRNESYNQLTNPSNNGPKAANEDE